MRVIFTAFSHILGPGHPFKIPGSVIGLVSVKMINLIQTTRVFNKEKRNQAMNIKTPIFTMAVNFYLKITGGIPHRMKVSRGCNPRINFMTVGLCDCPGTYSNLSST